MDPWTVRGMLEWMEGYLSERGDENPKASTYWLVSDALDMTRTELFLNFDMPLQTEQLDALRGYVKRRACGEPLQYITGKTFFRHIEVKVEPGVLIPRPETEVLVSEVLARIPQARCELDWSHDECSADRPLDNGSGDAEGEPVRVAEVGCGSGCIACSIAYENPGTEIWCTDISSKAVALTRRNSELIGVHDRVHPIECDLGSELEGKFDVVVSNPPYIPTAVMDGMSSEVVDYEPSLALDGGDDGLDVFRRILEWSKDALKEGGLLACELHEDCLEEASDLTAATGFRDICIVEDLAGKPRIILATR